MRAREERGRDRDTQQTRGKSRSATSGPFICCRGTELGFFLFFFFFFFFFTINTFYRSVTKVFDSKPSPWPPSPNVHPTRNANLPPDHHHSLSPNQRNRNNKNSNRHAQLPSVSSKDRISITATSQPHQYQPDYASLPPSTRHGDNHHSLLRSRPQRAPRAPPDFRDFQVKGEH